MCGDLYWKPTGPNQSAITVNPNVRDVIIDFGGYTLRQTDESQADNVGVLVNQNVENIQIRNGTITNFSVWGVEILGGTQEMILDSLNVTFCGYNGFTPFTGGARPSSGGVTISNTDINGM